MKPSSLLFFVSFPAALAASAPVALDTLVGQIVTQNPELHFYEAELAAARTDVRLAVSPAEPELAVQLGRKRVRDTAGTLVGEGTTWSISVAQTFEWPGRLGLRKALANRQVDLAELGLARFRAALTARASTLAFGLYAARENAAATAEVAARYRELREVFLQRDPAGLTPLLETRVLEAQDIALQRRADEATLALHAALVELNQLRGAPLDAELELAALAPPAAGTPALPGTHDLLTAARLNNFEFRQKQIELEQQGLAVSLARHERKPSVTVAPYVSQESAGDRERSFGLGLTIPLPVTPRGSAGVAAAEARRRQAEAAILVAAQALEREVLAAAQEFTTKRAALARWQTDAVQSLRDAAALADRHYRLGAVPLATYVELQNSYLDAVESLLATQREVLAAGLRLRELTGLDVNLASAQP